MIDKRIHRINELYKKSQKEGLTEEEKAEQLSLRKSVAANIRGNVDILMNKSRDWFGSDVPEEYERVIRSLFTVAAFLIEKQKIAFIP